MSHSHFGVRMSRHWQQLKRCLCIPALLPNNRSHRIWVTLYSRPLAYGTVQTLLDSQTNPHLLTRQIRREHSRYLERSIMTIFWRRSPKQVRQFVNGRSSAKNTENALRGRYRLGTLLKV